MVSPPIRPVPPLLRQEPRLEENESNSESGANASQYGEESRLIKPEKLMTQRPIAHARLTLLIDQLSFSLLRMSV